MKGKSILVVIASLFSICLVLAGCGSSSSATTPKETTNGTPTIASLSTDSTLVGSQDLTLSISGSGFVSGSSVSFGSNTLTPTAIASNQLSVVIPQSILSTAAIVQVSVTNPAPGGGISNALEFTIKNRIPTLESLSINSAVIGSPDLTINLSGKGFVAGAMVHFGSTDLTPATVTDTAVSFVIPEILLNSTGVIPIATSNPEPGGGISNALNFTVGNPVPTVTSFVSSSTLIDSTSFVLEIDGTGFVTGSEVSFGTDTLAPASVTPTHISVAVPDTLLTTARLVPVTVTNPEPIGGKSNALDFSVNNPVPTITALSVNTAEAGTDQDLTLSLTGSNFVSGATVDFGSQKLTPASSSGRNQIDVTIPAAAMSAGALTFVTVTNPEPGGGPSNVMTFRINNPVPQLSALSKTDAMAGEPAFDLELVGAKFVPTTTVNFGGTVLTPSTATKNSLVISVPETAFATGGVIQVSAVNPEPGGGNSQTIDFTINNPVPAITSVSPTSITSTGNDVTLTLNGSNFVSSSAVATTSGTASNQVNSTFISKTGLQVTLPAAIVSDAANNGTLALSVSNPEPSGGTSNSFNLVVHKKATLTWHPLADSSTMVPGTTVPFLVFGPPAVNNSGIVVFSGQSAFSTAESGETSATLGVYSVDQNTGTTSTIADSATLVPDPNTLTYGQSLAKFEGFPSSANIDSDTTLVGFAATNPPVLQLPDDGKAGTAGLYGNPNNSLITGVGLFTLDPYTYFQVPDMPAGTPFGALPVSPAVVNGSTFVFKGDYLNGTTVAMGVYYRDITGTSPVTLIASTVSTLIPNQGVTFGYIGAPSAVGNTVVFVGYNRQDKPSAGGIYSAPLATAPTSAPLVTIGEAVPGETSADTFTQFGDAVSFDGRYVGFWGAWGTETTTRHLTCSKDGFTALDAYCLTVFPNGFDAQIPLHQGIFVYDTTTNTLTAVAKTGDAFSDFTHWTFVGSLPEEGGPTTTGGNGNGSGDEVEVPLEAPAFVLTPNVMIAGGAGGNYQVAFDASTGSADGIYMTTGPDPSAIVTAVDTTMPATTINLNADSTTTIKALYIGREGMQGNWLTIGSTMVDSATQTTSNGIFAASTATSANQ